MPKVTVRMFATVREASGSSAAEFEVSDTRELFSQMRKTFGSRMSRMLDEAISDPERLVVLLNGRNLGKSIETVVKLMEGDEIAIFPPVSGG